MKSVYSNKNIRRKPERLSMSLRRLSKKERKYTTATTNVCVYTYIYIYIHTYTHIHIYGIWIYIFMEYGILTYIYGFHIYPIYIYIYMK